MGFPNLTRLITLILVLCAALALPAVAVADGDEAIRDCAEDGDLDGSYSDEELAEAERDMPSDLDAYSNCREVIRAARAGGRGSSDGTSLNDVAGVGGGTGSGGGSDRGDVSGNEGATPSDAQELAQREEAAREGSALESATELAAGANAGNDDDGLPTPALIVIALLGLAAVAGGVYLLRDHLPPGLTSRLPGASR